MPRGEKTCDQKHEPGSVPKAFLDLPASQANFAGQRHRCAVRAYEFGRKESADSEERLRRRVQSLQAELDALKTK